MMRPLLLVGEVRAEVERRSARAVEAGQPRRQAVEQARACVRGRVLDELDRCLLDNDHHQAEQWVR